MKSVLLIEDDNPLRTQWAEFLQRTGWRVYEAADGEEGLGLALKHQPSVVVCDLLAPGTNGFQICSALRREQPSPRTPIIAISGRGYASNRQLVLDAGADEFLSKPITPADLEAHLLRLTSKSTEIASLHNGPEEAWLRFWGVRGSAPVPGPSTIFYGGNTSCIEFRAGNQIIILDAGTGIRPLGQQLEAEFGDSPLDITLLISHTHWDHIQGFPFFLPVYEAKNRIRVLGYEGAHNGFASVFAAQMESPYFPVALKQLPAKVAIEELKDLEFEIGSVRVRAASMNHPGICMGFRLDTQEGAVAYLPDNEPFEGTTSDSEAYAHAEYVKMIEFIRDADVLIIDSQYDSDEYPQHLGWGHGCVDDVVQLALRANVKRLVLFHHDPNHDDQKVSDMTRYAASLADRAHSKLSVEAAREGQKLYLAEATRSDGHPRKSAAAG